MISHLKINKMKTQNNNKQKEVTLSQLNKDLKGIKKEMLKIKQSSEETEECVSNIFFRLRKDIPFIFQDSNGNELFKTFNLSILPKIGEKMNLRPMPGSCCLNKYLMDEFNLTEEQLTQHIIENKTSFSFVVSDVSTNIIVFESHPEDEFDDSNCQNFDEEEYNMTYTITLVPNNVAKKQVLIEKIN
jgi:hypothetical protein